VQIGQGIGWNMRTWIDAYFMLWMDWDWELFAPLSASELTSSIWTETQNHLARQQNCTFCMKRRKKRRK